VKRDALLHQGFGRVDREGELTKYWGWLFWGNLGCDFKGCIVIGSRTERKEKAGKIGNAKGQTGRVLEFFAKGA